MPSDTIQAIRENLKSGQVDRQSQALRDLSEFISEGDERALECIDDLFMCKYSDSHLITLQVWECIERLAETWPRELKPYQTELSQGAASEYQQVQSHAVQALLSLAQAIDGPLTIPPDAIRTGLSVGSSHPEFREKAFKVAGYIPDPGSVELLIGYKAVDGSRLQEVIQRSFNRIRHLALRTLIKDLPASEESAAAALRRLSEEDPTLVSADANKIAVAFEKTSQPYDVAEALINIARESRDQVPKIIVYTVRQLANSDTDTEVRACTQQILTVILEEYPQAGTALLAQQLDSLDHIETPPGSPKDPVPRIRKLTAALGHSALEDGAITGLAVLVADAPKQSEAVFTEIVDALTENPPDSVVKALRTLQKDLHQAPSIETGAEAGIQALLAQENNRQPRATSIRLLATLAGNPSQDLVNQVITELSKERPVTAGEAEKELLQALETLTAAAPSTATQHISELLSWLEASDTAVSIAALKVLQEVAAAYPDTVIEHTPALVECLDEDPAVQAQACKVIGNLNLYPIPPVLLDLKYNAESSEVRRVAYGAVDDLQERHDYPTFADIQEVASRVSLRNSTGVFRQRSTAPGGWKCIELSDPDQQILEQVAAWATTRSSGVIALPEYQPRQLVKITVEAVLARLNQAPTVAVFSPIWRNRWGNKGDIEYEYQRYGVSTMQSPWKVTPLHHLVPIARVTDDGTVDTDNYTRLDGCVPIVKHVSDLRAIENLDVIILNFTSLQKQEHDDLVHVLNENYPETSIIAVYSPYTEQKREYYPSYNPIDPSEATLPIARVNLDTAERFSGEAEASDLWMLDDNRRIKGLLQDATASELAAHQQATDASAPASEDQVVVNDRYSKLPNRIHIQPLGEPAVNDSLDAIYTHTQSLEDAGSRTLADRVFYKRVLLERLPVTPAQHDEWIRQSRLRGNHGVPDRIEEQIEELDRYIEGISEDGVISAAEQALLHFSDVIEELNAGSAIFEQFLEYIDLAAESQTRVILFCHKQTWAQMVRQILKKERQITHSDLESWGVAIVGPRELRDHSGYDVMVISGPLRPSMWSYYVFRGADAIEVLTYGTRWTAPIRDAVTKAVEDLGVYLTGDDQALSPPQITVGSKPMTGTQERPLDEDGELADRGPITNKDRLIQAFRTAAMDEEQAGRSPDEQRHFRIETEEENVLTKAGYERILRVRTEGVATKGRYHWTNPGLLSTGDEIIQLDGTIKQRLWEEHVRDLWEAQERDESFEKIATGLRLWYRTLKEIIANERARIEGSVDDGKLQEALAKQVKEAGSNRSRGAIEDWFAGVMGADQPMDLVREPSLRIGPQYPEDIQYTGEAFNRDQLVEYSAFIEAAMRAFRTTIRQEGVEFRTKLAEKLSSDEENHVKEAATWLTVSKIQAIDRAAEIESAADEDEDVDERSGQVT